MSEEAPEVRLQWESTPENVQMVCDMQADIIRATLSALNECILDEANVKDEARVYFSLIYTLTKATFQQIPELI